MKKSLVALLVLASFTMAGCGSGKKAVDSGSSENSSRIPEGDSTTKPVVKCSRISGDGITGEIRVYTDVMGRTLVDKVRINLTNLPSTFESSDYSIRFFRWMASYPNVIFSDSTPLKLWIEKRAGSSPITGQLDRIQWDEIDDILTDKGHSITSMDSAFEQFSFVVDLKDPDASYDALTIGLYKNGAAVQSINVLLPTYHANPNDYATDSRKKEARPTVLQDLHPFKTYIDSEISDEDYSGMATSLCGTL